MDLALPKGIFTATTPTPVARLTALMARGDEEAYRQFFERYFQRLLAYLLVVTHGNESLARDLVQQTMIKVARHIRVFEDEPALWRWLTLLARTAAWDESRKSRRYWAFLERLWRKPPADNPDPPESSLERLLSAEFEQLDPEDRFILQRKYLDECSVREIAAELSSSEKAVESRLTRVRAKLKSRLLNALKNEPS